MIPDRILEKVEIAGPGFMNFFIREGCWASLLEHVDREGDRYGSADLGKGRRIQVEFVSANPTGPLHIGHARGAVVGDVMANILAAVGYQVFREYYINDAGNQMNNLGKSVLLRYRELLGETVEFPEGCYRGDYIRDLAAELLKRDGDRYLNRDPEEVIPLFTDYAGSAILEGIKEDLRLFGVVFDLYFSERELYRDDGVGKLLRTLQEKDFIYQRGGCPLVQDHRLRRREGSGRRPAERGSDLLRRRYRLSPEQVSAGIRDGHRHLGRRSPRVHPPDVRRRAGPGI